MQELRDKVAVVTGAASGIGLGMATVFAREGMKVVLADVEQAALEQAAFTLSAAGAEVLAVPTDVSDRAAVFALAEAAMQRFGRVHVLCNNAGVGGATGGGRRGIWNAPPEAWDWVLGVNLMGVVNGLQAFVEPMLAHGEDGHIVNTSSVLGVWGGRAGIYGISKHAVTALTEGLWHELAALDANIGVSLLLPGLVATRINTAARNRPAALRGVLDLTPDMQQMMEQMESRYLERGMPPTRVGEIVVDAIRARQFYVFTHEGSQRLVEERLRAIVEGSDPSPGPRYDRPQEAPPDATR
jgi:NAD(P)-dependent dehydrogenase (short-subunit alcohol dehydrogenase family)